MSTSADLTHHVLTIASNNSRSYATQTIKGAIFKGGSNINGFPLSNYAKYAYTLLTRAAQEFYDALGIIKEGDRITDQDNIVYEVLHVDKIKQLNNTIYYECELAATKTFLLYQRTLPARGSETYNTITGEVANYTYTLYYIACIISPIKGTQTYNHIGKMDQKTLTVLTAQTYSRAELGTGKYGFPKVGDLILLTSDRGDYYEITSVDTYPNLPASSNTSTTYCSFTCELKSVNNAALSPPYLGPLEANEWNNVSDVTTDPRSRIKIWIDTYFTVTNVNPTSPTGINYNTPTSSGYNLRSLFSRFNYPAEVELNYYATFALILFDKTKSSPRYTHNNLPYGFNEIVPVTITASDYGQFSGHRVVEDIEQEIRRIATTYPIGVGTIRSVETAEHDDENIRQSKYYRTVLNINYLRPNDSYTNSGCTVTWGPSATPTGTFTFPNITRLKKRGLSNNARLTAPGRLGNWTQKLGLPDFIIEISCDLDLGDWMRPQNGVGGSKTDKIPEQVFQDIRFNGQLTGQTYQSLNLGYGAAIPVILDTVEVEETSNGKTLELVFYGYNSVTMTNYKLELGISP